MAETRPVLRPTDDEARALARGLMAAARHGALGVLDPATGAPVVTRIGVVPGPDGAPLALVSDLALHTRALRADPRASLLLGEPGTRGDPLTHPRLTLAVRAAFVGPDDPDRPALRAHYLKRQPKATLYIDFPDFHLVRLGVVSAALNGGFGRAFALTPADLGL
jgi:putative heme iron utilization protein